MNASIKSLGIDRLDIEDRLKLVEEIWDSIAADSDALHLTEAQRTELDRRFNEYEKNPDLGSPWPEVKARILKRD